MAADECPDLNENMKENVDIILKEQLLRYIEVNDKRSAQRLIYNNPDLPYEIFIACIRYKRRTRIFKFLLKSPSYPLLHQQSKNSLLRYICKVGWDVSGLIKLAIEGGANPDTSNEYGENCLFCLASDYSPSLEYWLNNYLVNLSQLSSVLYQTCVYGLVKNCRVLINYAQEHYDKFDYTLGGNVWYSIAKGKPDTLKLFLQAGLNINYITNRDYTILH